jgi:hypothetical protein
MQTFLPYPSFEQSAKCLDKMRLGKQRVEAWQIYQALIGGKQGWSNHPATKMWKNYEDALLLYGQIICLEWKQRGCKDTLLEKFVTELRERKVVHHNFIKHPSWWGSNDFHASHRSNLLRKGNEDGLWNALIAYEKENGEDEFVLQFPYQKEKMDKIKYKLLEQKFLNVTNYYAQFGWKESMELEYVWNV